MNTVRTFFQENIEEKHLTGATYAISINGDVICRETLGYSDCEQSIPLKANSIFRIASMTKPITAVATMICKERGLIDLDAPINRYIKGFSHGGVGILKNGVPVFVGEAREITLRDIFTHSSGIGSGELGNYQFLKLPTPSSLFENVMGWNGLFLDFPTGSRSKYSGVVAFEIAALIVEIVSQMPFEKFLQEEIFSKLGMKDTCYSLSADQTMRLVEMPFHEKNGTIKKMDFGLRGFSAFSEGYPGGSAGLFSTLDDYLTFVHMLANGGEWNGVRILSEKSVKEMRSRCFEQWGISMYVRNDPEENQPLPRGSFGWSGAYGTHFWIEPESKVCAVLMLNHANCGGSSSRFSKAFEKLVTTELSTLR